MSDLQSPVGRAEDAPEGVPVHNALVPQPTRSALPLVVAAAQLAGILLPQEHVEFGSRPHRIVMIRPAITALVGVIAEFVALLTRVHPIVKGHHVNVALFTTEPGVLLLGSGSLLLLIGVVGLLNAVVYYGGYRVVATNRRVFIITGILGRKVTPIGNTSMAGSRLVQGLFGRMFDFGNIITSFGRLNDLCEPVQLYRALQAVANGVDGETWTPPIRQTIIP